MTTAWYRAGTATIAAGNVGVTGNLTAWAAQVRPGDAITFDSGASWHEVATVAGNTALTLATPAVASVTNGAYAVQRTSPEWSDVGVLATRVADMLEATTDVYSGAGAPAATLGSPNALYFDTAASTIYRRGDTAWGPPVSLVGPPVSLGAVAQSIVPDTHDARDLGAPAARWRNGYIKTLYVVDTAVDAPAGTSRGIVTYTSGVLRWELAIGGPQPETGSDAGSNWYLNAFSDTGGYKSTPLFVSRQTSQVDLPFASFGSNGATMFAPPRPGADNVWSLGTASARWSVVYAATGTIATSDARLKTDVVDCPLGLDFVRALRPVLYRWRDGGNDVAYGPSPLTVEETVDGVTRTVPSTVPGALIATPRPGRRLHAGLLAQDVRAALDAAGVDCGVWVRDDPGDADSTQSLRYEQLIAPLIVAIQQLAKRVDALEAAGCRGVDKPR